MAEIFLSYANEDRERAREVALLLESAGWTVWWDRHIPAGRTWRSVVEDALNEMRCMVVLWSAQSVVSHWVKEEAEEARMVQKLVPVLIETVRPPVGFRAIQAADLTEWDGSRDAVGALRLIADLEARLGKPARRGMELYSPTPEPGSRAATGGDEGHGAPHSAPAPVREVSVEREIVEPSRGIHVVDDRKNINRTAIGIAGAALLLAGVLWFWPKDEAPTAIPPVVEKTVDAPAPVLPSLLRVAVSAESSELKAGETLNMRAKGEYSDGSGDQVLDAVGWRSSNPQVASVDAAGMVRALQPGVSKIIARQGAVESASFTLTVRAPEPVKKVSSEAVAPKPPKQAVKIAEPVVKMQPVPAPSAPVLPAVPPTPAALTGDQLRQKVAPYLSRAKDFRSNGNYSAALAELDKALVIDPASAAIRREVEQTRRACNAEKSLGNNVSC